MRFRPIELLLIALGALALSVAAFFSEGGHRWGKHAWIMAMIVFVGAFIPLAILAKCRNGE